VLHTLAHLQWCCIWSCLHSAGRQQGIRYPGAQLRSSRQGWRAAALSLAVQRSRRLISGHGCSFGLNTHVSRVFRWTKEETAPKVHCPRFALRVRSPPRGSLLAAQYRITTLDLVGDRRLVGCLQRLQTAGSSSPVDVDQPSQCDEQADVCYRIFLRSV